MSAIPSESKISVKVIGANGQISLGKEFAGKQVLVEEREPGVWLVRAAIVIPENEFWLHQSKPRQDLQEAVDWAIQHPVAESDPDIVIKRLENAGKSSGKTRSTRPK